MTRRRKIPHSRKFDHGDITVVVANLKTLHLLRTALTSLYWFYPKIRTILIDNGSCDASTSYIKKLGKRKNVTAVVNKRNKGHGPAMNQGIVIAETPYVFTYDTDCEVLKGGALEQMLGSFRQNKSLYAIGWLRYVNKSGTPASPRRVAADKSDLWPYIHPSIMMLDRAKYLKLRQFAHHGAPCTRNMIDATQAGYTMQNFPGLGKHIKHLGAGTRRMFGPPNWNPKDKKAGGWREKGRWPL